MEFVYWAVASILGAAFLAKILWLCLPPRPDASPRERRPEEDVSGWGMPD
jgi:hypothetical protein